MIMFKFSKVITILVCAVVASNAVACQRGHSAFNQNGSDKVIAQLRHSWKNVGVARTPTHRSSLAGKQGKARFKPVQGQPGKHS
jgi:hypothetical protein